MLYKKSRLFSMGILVSTTLATLSSHGQEDFCLQDDAIRPYTGTVPAFSQASAQDQKQLDYVKESNPSKTDSKEALKKAGFIVGTPETIVKHLLETGSSGEKLLDGYASGRNGGMVKLLLGKGIRSEKALENAVSSGNTENVKLLLEAGIRSEKALNPGLPHLNYYRLKPVGWITLAKRIKRFKALHRKISNVTDPS